MRTLGSDTTVKEKVAIMSQVTPKATAKEVKQVKTEYIKQLEKFRANYKELSLWSDELIMKANQGGYNHGRIVPQVIALADNDNIPTEDEILDAKSAYNNQQDELKRQQPKLTVDEVIERDKQKRAELNKPKETKEEVELNKLIHRANSNTHELRVPTRTKGNKLDKATKNDMVLALKAQGFTDKDIKEFRS